jgi:hypothetical protein
MILYCSSLKLSGEVPKYWKQESISSEGWWICCNVEWVGVGRTKRWKASARHVDGFTYPNRLVISPHSSQQQQQQLLLVVGLLAAAQMQTLKINRA